MPHVILSLDDLHAMGIRLSRSQIWRREKEGKFPRRVRVSDARVGWFKTEVDAFLAASRGIASEPAQLRRARDLECAA